MSFFQFFYVYENTVFDENLDYNRATVSSITGKILVCSMKSCYKNISKIPDVTFFFSLIYVSRGYFSLEGKNKRPLLGIFFSTFFSI